MNILILTIFSFVLILACGGCSPSEDNAFPSTRKFINEYVPGDSKRIKYKDTHGGFHGDGELRAIFRLTEAGRRDFEDRIANDPEWKDLPVFEDARSYVSEEWVNATNGKYFFHDFQPDRYPRHPAYSGPVFQRGSFNFCLFVYDREKGIIYVYNIDT